MKDIYKKQLELKIYELRNKIKDDKYKLEEMKNELRSYNRSMQTEKQKENMRKAITKRIMMYREARSATKTPEQASKITKT